MALVEDVIAQLKAEVADLGGRVDGAEQLSELMGSNRLPEVTPAANVIPLGIRGRQADSSAGMFTQVVGETVGVVLTLRASIGSRDGARTLLPGLIDDVIAAVAGWAPQARLGIFELSRGNLVGLTNSAVIYQIDFTINDQLRIQR